jgi:hypothetical protein
MARRTPRQESCTLVNGELVHPEPEVARAQAQRNRQPNERLAPVFARLSPPDANGTPRRNGTPGANEKAVPARKGGTVATVVDGEQLPTAATSPTPTGDAAAASNHGAGGRFVAGNRAAAGNPFHRAVAARRKALLDAVSPDDIAQVGKKLCELALAGDVAAAKVLLLHVVGKPHDAADPDRLDVDEVRLLLEAPDLKEVLTSVQDGIAPDVAAGLVVQLLLANPARIAGLLGELHGGC